MDGLNIIKYAPREWTGPNCVVKRYSRCHPALLDLLAEAKSESAGDA